MTEQNQTGGFDPHNGVSPHAGTEPHNDRDQTGGFDPRAAMSLADATEAKTARALFPHTPLLYAGWGTAWLIGYGALHGAEHGWLPLSTPAALIVLFAMIALGVVVSAILTVRASVGIRGASSFQGGLYGWTWVLAFVVVGLLAGIIADSIAATDLRGLIINSLAVLVVGMMYMCGGAMWRDIPMAALGVWFLVVDVVGMVAGPQHYLTVFVTLGVLGFYVGAVVELVRSRRRRSLA
ncbi:hypothetical protein [Arthrobacter castelli]|uniref:hypothetical protein n=1 Tax=Arthrobacter castelli TaxID=271431 RepID=UPI0004166022|nr:hypothetical protein [Arthrobacter castelli]